MKFKLRSQDEIIEKLMQRLGGNGPSAASHNNNDDEEVDMVKPSSVNLDGYIKREEHLKALD